MGKLKKLTGCCWQDLSKGRLLEKIAENQEIPGFPRIMLEKLEKHPFFFPNKRKRKMSAGISKKQKN